GAPLVVAAQQPDCAVAVPALERVRLLQRLAVGVGELQHRARAVVRRRADDVAAEPGRVRGAERQPPLLRDLVCDPRRVLPPARDRYRDGVGHRYASACRFASDGSFVRMSRSRTRSISATTTVSSSGACASTVPHGSTISERPYAGFPRSVSPTCPAAATYSWFSIARARSSTCQWSRPVGVVKCAGTVTSSAPSSARIRYSSGKRTSEQTDNPTGQSSSCATTGSVPGSSASDSR